MNSTGQSKNTGAIASAPITSAANYARHESAAGASATAGGMNTSTAGTPNATGTSTTTIATSQPERSLSPCGAGALAREPKQKIKPRSQSGLLLWSGGG